MSERFVKDGIFIIDLKNQFPLVMFNNEYMREKALDYLNDTDEKIRKSITKVTLEIQDTEDETIGMIEIYKDTEGEIQVNNTTELKITKITTEI